ncbi:HAMP domain-containing sensor histidine kinase [Virgibacillus sp. LDC-1]|uniref:sensor histidine kinase n=1 Tax=Virgibacillus sp. LDC-1 TaxID=3039856 RepID=UPI0024DE7EB0|nr:HAMP domain-containing sensor histidine kinase [Virgibacillus sp. LDC-1]
MKLQDQLNLAFTTLLLVIMTVTGYVIYSLILGLLIQDEQRQLEQKGEILVNVLNEQFGTEANSQQFNAFLQEQDLQLFLYNRKQDYILYSTLPTDVARGFFVNNNFSDTDKNLWELGKDKYVTSRIVIYPETVGLELILLTPMKDLQAVQHNFIVRLLIVFLIGAMLAVLLSFLFTRKLVTPLSHLKAQLKKIEQRKFNEVQPIKATGEINDVAKGVYEMADELQRYINTQQTFFQNASHELKTPLMTIQGYAEGIKERVFDEAEQEKGLEVMITEVGRLKKIINEMILLAKLESEQTEYQPEEVTVRNLMELVQDRVLPLVNENHIYLQLEIKDDFQLHADEEKLLRALSNLVVNGIRHAEQVVRITAFRDKQTMSIVVEDDGEGVPKDLVPHIFHRFVKGKDGETGLGLPIARAIIEQSGGRITLTASELGGAKFHVSFPASITN